MPLITCPDCQTEISDAASSCIKCGRPMKSEAIVSEVFIPPPSLNIFEATATCFRKYADFSGRASRSEFWYFYLFSIIAGTLIAVLSILLASMTFFVIAMLIAFLVTILPDIAVTTRRLHDTNKAGWWQLLQFVPFGFVILFVMCIQRSDQHVNSHD
jgi:uncharacterized membrane protein YhaH (DUF805 family)